MGDTETLLQIVEQDGGYAVQKKDRGGAWHPQAVTGTLDTARRYLIWEISNWVASARRPPGQALAAEPALAGFTLVDLGSGGLELRWTEPGGQRWIRFPGSRWRGTAIRFARYADATEEAIAGRSGTSLESGPTAQQRHLIAWGTELFRRISPDPDLTLTFRLLPDDDAVLIVHPVRGGGSIYVAADETVLFAASAIAPHKALEAFRSGTRTPVDRFVARAASSSGA
ncbi:hypothetical protein V6U90_24515 [Micromonospora sp. CPCC 206060]|uniref:hypothetical protein n=1 Tax=Micromonospora sp. CPCC 206060 TaxID=3122406 RepID=UPI002FF16B0B